MSRESWGLWFACLFFMDCFIFRAVLGQKRAGCLSVFIRLGWSCPREVLLPWRVAALSWERPRCMASTPQAAARGMGSRPTTQPQRWSTDSYRRLKRWQGERGPSVCPCLPFHVCPGMVIFVPYLLFWFVALSASAFLLLQNLTCFGLCYPGSSGDSTLFRYFSCLHFKGKV